MTPAALMVRANDPPPPPKCSGWQADLDDPGHVHGEGAGLADEHEDAHVQGECGTRIGQEDDGVEVDVGVVHHRLQLQLQDTSQHVSNWGTSLEGQEQVPGSIIVGLSSSNSQRQSFSQKRSTYASRSLLMSGSPPLPACR